MRIPTLTFLLVTILCSGLWSVQADPLDAKMAPEQMLPWELTEEGYVYLGNGDYENARRFFVNALKGDPEQPKALMGLATCLYWQDDIPRAQRTLEILLRKWPEHAGAMALKGSIAWRQNDLDRARELFAEAVNRDPGDAQLNNNLAVILFELGKMDEAIRQLETALRADNRYSDAHYNMAVFLASGKWPKIGEARAYYEKALNLGHDTDNKLEQVLYQ